MSDCAVTMADGIETYLSRTPLSSNLKKVLAEDRRLGGAHCGLEHFLVSDNSKRTGAFDGFGSFGNKSFSRDASGDD